MSKMKIYSLMGAISLFSITTVPAMASVKEIGCNKVKGSMISIGKGGKSIKVNKRTLNPDDDFFYFKFLGLDTNPELDNVFHIRFATKFAQKKGSFHRVRLLRNIPKTVCHKKNKKIDFKVSSKKVKLLTTPKEIEYNRFWKKISNSDFLRSDNPRSWHFRYKSDDINNNCVDTRDTVERGEVEDLVSKKKYKKPLRKILNYDELNKKLPLISKNTILGGIAYAESGGLNSYIWFRKNKQFYSSILIDAEGVSSKATCYQVSLKVLLGRLFFTKNLKPDKTEFHVKKLPSTTQKPIVNYKRIYLKWN